MEIIKALQILLNLLKKNLSIRSSVLHELQHYILDLFILYSK